MRRFALIFLLTSCGGSESDPATTPATDSAVVVEDTASDDTSTPPDDTATPADTNVAMTDSTAADTPAMETGFGPYPAGPYGNKVGDVVANLTWEGYVNLTADAISTTKPYVTADLDKLRRDAKKGYALVHVSEFF